MNLPDLAKLVKEKGASLFFGAGFSMDSGGPGGTQLLRELKSYFGNIPTDDLFIYLGRVIEYDTDIRKEVENVISKYLQKIEVNDNQRYILSIPWKAILTTNYDHIPDSVERSIDGNREIDVIVKLRGRGINIKREDKLYCFKLFGDYSYKYPEDGYMVLTNEDRRQSVTRLEPFFKLFKELAMSGNIIYLGYSFMDELVFELLSDLSFSWKQIPWKGYAISPNIPSEQQLKQLNKFNVSWIEGDVNSFVVEFKKVFSNNPTSYTTEKKLMILNNIGFDISRETQLNCRDNISYIHENSSESVFTNPKYFFEGVDDSFYPFYKEWDIKRQILPSKMGRRGYSRYTLNSSEYVKERLNATSFNQNIKTIVMGNAGSGKSIVAKRLAYNWYRNGGPVLFIEPKSYRIDGRAIEGFIDEVILKYQKRLRDLGKQEESLRFLMVADNCSVFIDSIVNIYNHLTSNGYLIDLLVLDRRNKILSILNDMNFDAVYEISDTLEERDHRDLLRHFKSIRLDISEEIFMTNIRNPEINDSFFALMYSTIRETQKPLKQIIVDEYLSLDDECRKVYSLVSLFESLGVKSHISLVIKYTNVEFEWLFENIKNGKLSGILRIDSDEYVKTNHHIISGIVDKYEFTSTPKYFAIFHEIIDKITKGNELEEEFIHDLLINRIAYPFIDIRINRDKVIELYLRILEKYETRLLYHHLAIHYLHAGDYDSGKYCIRKAHKTYYSKYGGRKESLMDTEGRLELLKAEICIENNLENEAWGHLDRAERYFGNAMYDLFSPHPMQGLARTYYLKGSLSEGNAKYNYCLIALSKIKHLELNVEEEKFRSYELRNSIYSEIDKFINENSARNIAEVFKNPDGYAFLSEKHIEEKKYKDALELIDEGLSFGPSMWLLTQKIKVLKILYPNNMQKIEEALDMYQKLGIYDLHLSFELAKLQFYNRDYYKSYQEFQRLKTRSENYRNKLAYSPENILYEGGNPIPFKGILVAMPRYSIRGTVRCYDISTELRDISVRYYDVKYQGSKEKDPVNFNIFFNYTGPQAMNVTKR